MGEEDLTPAQRSLRAKLAAHTSWANTADRAARTAAARKAANERFARQVDPDGTLPPRERAERAENARKAYFTALALLRPPWRGLVLTPQWCPLVPRSPSQRCQHAALRK